MKKGLRIARAILWRLVSTAPDYLREAAGLGGVALIAYGIWEIYEPAGIVALGVQLLAGALLAGRAASTRADDQ